MSLPEHPQLAAVAESLEATRAAAALCDAEWNLVWVSNEMKEVLGTHEDDEIGIGRHVLEAYLSDTWCTTITTDTQINMFLEHFPRLIPGTPGGKARIVEMFTEALNRWRESEDDQNAVEFVEAISDVDVEGFLEHMEPAPQPLLSTEIIEFIQGDLAPLAIVEINVRLHDEDGAQIGTAIFYASGLPARVLALVSRGDEAMYERMARLYVPGRRSAAVLFADLQDSAVLSRRLPSAAYFHLVRSLTTAIDDIAAANDGIVGKHAGDGVTAFFLADDLGSPSAAARAAMTAAREISIAAGRVAKEVGEETGLVTTEDCLVNVGVHWGGTLYIGQLVTGGRLEVTALGDEVNECARIQETACDGEALVSKTLVEHLDDSDARALGIDPDNVVYRTIGELPGASEKAIRDAGGIPVTVL